MSKTYSAGIVTAYGAAKRAGYQGTYEDFCRQQAEYAESAAAVEAAKTAAQTAANTATTKAGEATTAATAAQTANTQTEQAASQALTDIAAARSDAISAVQTEGATQTANATAQAQAAATSATTASTKASEASASATSAGQSATNATASATSAANAASAAQTVLESIPEDYSDLSEDVDQIKANLGNVIGINTYVFTDGGYITTSSTGTTASITPVANSAYSHIIIPCTAGQSFTVTGETDGNSGRRVYMLLDTNYKVLFRYTESATVAQQVTAESDGYLVVNTFTASAHSVEDYRSSTVIEQLAEVESGIADVSVDLGNLSIEKRYPLESWANGYVRDNGSVGSATQLVVCGYNSGEGAVKKGDGFKYKIEIATGFRLASIAEYSSTQLNSFVGFCDISGGEVTFDSDKYYIIVAGKDPAGATSPSDMTADALKFTRHVFTDDTLTLSGKSADSKVTGNEIREIKDRLGIEHYSFSSGIITTVGTGNTASFTPVSDAGYAHAIIPCVKGQPFVVTATSVNNSGRRVYMFVDSNMMVVYKHNATISVQNAQVYAPCDGYLVVNALVENSYSASSGFYKYDTIIRQNYNDLRSILNAPLSNLTPNFLGAMAYRQLGALSKGYICMITDDGREGLATDTIPFAIEKDVPFTFAVMSSSEVFQNETYTATVLDAVNNHGCSLAQHGDTRWDDKSEEWLNEFFDNEAEFWETLGVEVKGAVIPGHWTNELIKAVCGGRFKVVRSGYSGTDYDTQQSAGTVTNYYEYYTSGERSNIFCLSSYNCAGNKDAYNKSAVDYAKANHKIMIVYFHENAMTTELWEVVESMVDYAKVQGLEFVTLGQIPYLL